MNLKTVLIALLSVLLIWSVYINKKTIVTLEYSQGIIARQEKSIDQKDQIIKALRKRLKNQEKTKKKRNQEVELLARLINAEAGAEWCTSEMKRLVGVVALNRTKHKAFPDTLKEVIYQQGQYKCVIDGNINKQPTKECYIIAENLLTNGYDDPKDVIWQSEFIQGKRVYKKIKNMYFCI